VSCHVSCHPAFLTRECVAFVRIAIDKGLFFPCSIIIACEPVDGSHVANKTIAQRRTHDLTKGLAYIREYSIVRPIGHISFKSFQCLSKSSLTVEYSRMKVPSLSRGCDVAQFFCSQCRYSRFTLNGICNNHHTGIAVATSG